MHDIDWGIVSANLKCPICGERGHLEPGSDGTEAYHTHRWAVTREEAARITSENRSPKEKLINMVDGMSEQSAAKAMEILCRSGF